MCKKLISIVIPFYNAEKFIKETINSVLNQTYNNIEILLINDGSTDNSLNIVNSLKDDRIKIINKNNSGVSSARNLGLSLAKGDYILFLDADDVLENDFLEKMVEKLENNKNAVFCTSLVYEMNEDLTKILKISKGIYNNIAENVLFYHFETIPSAFLLKRDFLIENKIKFNELLSSTADRMFLLDLHKKGAEGIIENSAILYYRRHRNSMSFRLTENLVNDNKLFYELININDFIKNRKKLDYAIFLKFYILGNSYFKLLDLRFIKYFFLIFYKFHLKAIYYLIKIKTKNL